MDTRTYERDGYVVTFAFPVNDRPTVQYADGPEHVLFSDQHATEVEQTLTLVGYTRK